MRIRWWTLGIAVSLLASSFRLGSQGPTMTPITDAILERPAPGDWIHWRRTLDAWAHSPLTQIDTGNASRLQLAWSRALRPGVSEPAPLVHDGLMFIPQAAGVVLALDATTGDLVWEYVRKFERSPEIGLASRLRSLAMHGQSVFVATPDAHLVALDARTGKVMWDHAVADDRLGYRYTSGPIVVKGKVIAGMTGCERFKDDVCFISAHDAQTGREVWRTATIERPGERGEDTWGGLPLKRRAGGDAWIPGSYDPGANLIYWSVAQAKPWARISRGTDGDALYTNSTLALHPETGKIVWYRQFIPGETHDQDEVFESVLVDHRGRRSLFKMGKLGILWELDRATGKFLAAHDLGYQTLLDVEPSTGRVSYRPHMLPKPGVELEFCPSIDGVRNWQATAYDPNTSALLIPIHPACQRGTFFDRVEPDNLGDFPVYGRQAYTGWKAGASLPHPKSPDRPGALIAMDIDSGRLRWEFSMRALPSLAALTTAGRLAVNGDRDGYFYVHDVATGKVLFQTRLPAPLLGFPITYAVDGRQFLTATTGGGANGGNAIFVFALPRDAR